jgi:hypothetical protein
MTREGAYQATSLSSFPRRNKSPAFSVSKVNLFIRGTELWTNKLHDGETLVGNRREDGLSEKQPRGMDREGEALHELEWWDEYCCRSHVSKDSQV